MTATGSILLPSKGSIPPQAHPHSEAPRRIMSRLDVQIRLWPDSNWDSSHRPSDSRFRQVLWKPTYARTAAHARPVHLDARSPDSPVRPGCSGRNTGYSENSGALENDVMAATDHSRGGPSVGRADHSYGLRGRGAARYGNTRVWPEVRVRRPFSYRPSGERDHSTRAPLSNSMAASTRPART